MCDGAVGLVGMTGDVGLPGLRGETCGGHCETSTWRLMLEKEYPHGWEENSHAGIRGTWGAVSETELLEHLIYWLEQCDKKPGMQDPAGNAYCGVDRNVVRQTLESLRRYRRLLTQPLGKQIADGSRDGGKTAEGPKGIY